jgi:hypothetical protein
MLSIYIPRIGNDITEQIIIDEFASSIGVVSRVDFTAIGKRRGFMEPLFQHDHQFVSAFVHFDSFYENYYDAVNGYEVDISGLVQIIEDEAEPYEYYPYCTTGYWLLLKNRSPIPATFMNNHQIVDSGRILEERLNGLEYEFFSHEESANYGQSRQKKTIKKLKAMVESQQKTIEELLDQVNATQLVVNQLIGGLFNQHTQTGIQQLHLDILYERKKRGNYENTSEWTSFPTTRQGDSNETRIELLEQCLGIKTTSEVELDTNASASDDSDDNDDCYDNENDDSVGF